MSKLSESEINEYFEKHLPYRVGIMLAHYKMTRPGRTDGHAWLAPCFEASVITGRSMLNVLGVFKRKKTDVLYNKTPSEYGDDDVHANDLGGTFVNVDTLPETDKQLFTRFIRMADKACAHLTTPQPHDWQNTHEAIRRICHYLRLHLFRAAGRPCPELDEFLDGLQTTVLHNPYGTSPTVITTITTTSPTPTTDPASEQ